MAKKNLASLMNGIMGDDKPSEKPAVSQAPKTESPEEPQPKRKRGRPQRPSDSGDIRASIIVNQEVMRKIKYIALLDGYPIKDTIDIALREYIDRWKEDHSDMQFPNL